MANKAGKMGAGAKGLTRKRFEVGTENKCVRLLTIEEGKKRFVWAVEDGKGFRHVSNTETELR